MTDWQQLFGCWWTRPERHSIEICGCSVMESYWFPACWARVMTGHMTVYGMLLSKWPVPSGVGNHSHTEGALSMWLSSNSLVKKTKQVYRRNVWLCGVPNGIGAASKQQWCWWRHSRAKNFKKEKASREETTLELVRAWEWTVCSRRFDVKGIYRGKQQRQDNFVKYRKMPKRKLWYKLEGKKCSVQ